MTTEPADDGDLKSPNWKLVAQSKAWAKAQMEVMELLSAYELRLESLSSSSSNTFVVPELVEGDKRKAREALFTSLSSLFMALYTSLDHLDVTSFAVYSCLNSRISRAVGMYQAISRAQDDMREVNQSLGDPSAIEMPSDGIQRVLSSLDEVDFVRQVGTSMGVNQSDLDRIVSLVIAREFGSGKGSAPHHVSVPDPIGRSVLPSAKED